MQLYKTASDIKRKVYSIHRGWRGPSPGEEAWMSLLCRISKTVSLAREAAVVLATIEAGEYFRAKTQQQKLQQLLDHYEP